MGDRGQVLIRDTGVYLYTHCGRHKLVQDIKNVLRNNSNWKDPGRMARDISREMDCDIIGNQFCYNYLLIVMDCKYEKIEVIEYPTDETGKLRKEHELSFDDFLDYREEE